MRTTLTILWIVMIGVLASFSAWAQADPQTLREAADLWNTMRREDVNSEQFAQAQANLNLLIGRLSEDQKVPVAATLMQRGNEDAINAAAIQLFGTDGLPAMDIEKILQNSDRTWPQRVLVRTYYQFLEPEYETRLTPQARRALLDPLARRLRTLAEADVVPYGEQRLLTHMLQAALSRYAGRAGTVPQYTPLAQAMQAYAATPARADDVLTHSIQGWLDLQPDPSITTVPEALQVLGHWDALSRNRAALYLAGQIRSNPALGEQVLAQLGDPRDEVRAAAASVFSYALSYQPDVIVPAMVKFLVWDRGVLVQDAASGVLIAHSDEAQQAAELLLDAMENRKPRPGPKRSTAILRTLSYLIGEQTPAPIKARLLKIAQAYLFPAPDHAAAPQGALRALEALGADARSAIPAILRYRRTADRFTRQYIDRHVLQSIDPEVAKRVGG